MPGYYADFYRNLANNYSQLAADAESHEREMLQMRDRVRQGFLPVRPLAGDADSLALDDTVSVVLNRKEKKIYLKQRGPDGREITGERVLKDAAVPAISDELAGLKARLAKLEGKDADQTAVNENGSNPAQE
jgi:hypothetical protein